MNRCFFRSLYAVLVLLSVPAYASESGQDPLPQNAWGFSRVFGTYDRAALQRGFKIYREVCSSCHSMKQLYYRNLESLGYTPEEVAAIAKEYTVVDGPDDEGEMFERPAVPSDRFKSPFLNAEQAKAANGGAMPPDFSLIVNARHGGADYVRAILTGYEEPPPHEVAVEGTYWNRYFPGHRIKMAPPITAGQVAYEDGSPETLSQYASDVAEFLAWASDPVMEERKKTGLKALIFLFLLSGVLYAVKKRVWSKLH